MKHCPFCAEEIQDAAVVCRYCGRELGTLPLPREEPGASLSRVLRGGELAFGALVVAAVAYLFFGTVEPRAGRAASPLLPAARAERRPPPPPPPLVLAVLDSVFTLPAGEHVDTAFTVTDPRPCTLTGRVRGVSGGDRDVDVLVLDEGGAALWHTGGQPVPLYRSGRASAATLEVPLPRPGTYSLLVSNHFSVFTPKTVQVEKATVTCRSPAPAAQPAL